VLSVITGLNSQGKCDTHSRPVILTTTSNTNLLSTNDSQDLDKILESSLGKLNMLNLGGISDTVCLDATIQM